VRLRFFFSLQEDGATFTFLVETELNGLYSLSKMEEIEAGEGLAQFMVGLVFMESRLWALGFFFD
jgi:hypothetical protein